MLSKKAKYALHALKYLAVKYGEGPILIGEIAISQNISQKFLEAILLELKHNGIVASKKGRGGGYYLLKPPGEIPLVRIIRLVDGPIAMLPCVSLNYYEACEECEDESKCGLNKVMTEVRDMTLNILKNRTLSDLA